MHEPPECETEHRRRSTLTEWARIRAAGLLRPVGQFLGRLGIHPNTVTGIGFLLQVGIGLLFAFGSIRLGGVLLLVVAPIDALDGAVARAIGVHNPFGAFLDSTLDRLSDAALILGLTTYHLQKGELLEVALLLIALVFSLMVSYTRARAECLGVSCKVGLLTRMERVFLIGLLTLLGLPTVLGWALAILSSFTFLQRVIHVYAACSRQA